MFCKCNNRHIHKFVLKAIVFIGSFLLVFNVVNYPNEIIKLSNSESFNVKLWELHNLENRHYDIISIGSSLTLMNLNSQILITDLSNNSYHNLSSWGFRINNDFKFLKLATELYAPKLVITVSYMQDFTVGYLKFNNAIVKCYMRGLPTFLLRPFYYADFKYNRQCQKYMNALGKTYCLNYDQYGGVNVDVNFENRLENRWNEESRFIYDSLNVQYCNLDSICEFLERQNIKYVFVQSPTRYHYIKNNVENINKHIKKVKSIVEKYNHLFILPQNYYDDSCFDDCIHMNIKGSALLTQEIARKINSELQDNPK